MRFIKRTPWCPNCGEDLEDPVYSLEVIRGRFNWVCKDCMFKLLLNNDNYKPRDQFLTPIPREYLDRYKDPTVWRKLAYGECLPESYGDSFGGGRALLWSESPMRLMAGFAYLFGIRRNGVASSYDFYDHDFYCVDPW